MKCINEKNMFKEEISVSDKYILTDHKLYWHLERVNEWMNETRIPPLYIDMGITQFCNIACKYCVYATPEKRTNKMIPTNALIYFLKEASEIGVKAVGFLGDGEPMIHPGVYDSVIAGSKLGLDMAISTNGLVLKSDKLKDFLAALTWIRFHIGTASSKKYEIVMGAKKNNYYKVVANIEKCVNLKKRYNLPITIGIQMVLIPECVDEIIKFAKLGKDIGVDYAVIKQYSEMKGLEHKLVIKNYEHCTALFQEAETYVDDKYNIIIKRRKMRQDKRRYDRCFGCEFLPQISGNGDVYNCGNFFGNKSYFIGNIVKEKFKDIVFGDRYLEVMKRTKNNIDVHNECGIGCRQNEINEFLWKLKHPPAHINFI